jgi:hypothetical protein
MSFFDSRERVARAYTHRKVLAETWADFLTDEPYAPIVDVQNDGRGTIGVTPTYEPLPTIFSLIIGEILYQLRAALDACIYGAAILDSGRDPPPDAKYLEFPFCSSRDVFERTTRKIGPLSEQRRAIIESVQSYNAPQVWPYEFCDNQLLGLLNDLARKDRHRRLQVCGSWASDADPRLRLPEGVVLESMRVYSRVFLEDQSEIAEFRLSGWKPGLEINANPNLAIDIALNEPLPVPFSDSNALNIWCDPMFKAVTSVIDRIAAATPR